MSSSAGLLLFSIDDEGLNEAYMAHRAAYQRIFERLGGIVIEPRSPVRWVTPAGRRFTPTIGEDTFVRSAGAAVVRDRKWFPEEIEDYRGAPGRNRSGHP